MRPACLLLLASMALARPASQAAALPSEGLFARTNLVAWCIVPFDSKRRGPEERAAMLEALGVRRLAYDWRAEHIPTFDAEVEALNRHGIELTAWWFPAALNDEARAILACLERHRLHPQLWVTLGTEPEPDPDRLAVKMDEAFATLSGICEAAARVGSTVGLYNHLGWFGEPVHQVNLMDRLCAAGHTNVGAVYNFHHAHDQMDRLGQTLALLQPHLLAVNLNGMVRGGDRTGRKIVPLGQGDEELRMLRQLVASGWRGPVGILGHTDEDAEVKLRKELDGIAKLTAQLGPEGSGATSRRRPAGEPAVSGREPGTQGEKDWVDNRWQESDIGPFLASNLRLPSGVMIAKALTIRVGADGLAAVAYDTATASPRAAWTGGFLQLDPTRFGLIGTPRPASEPRLVFPATPAWGDQPVAMRGWNVHGQRTVLDYQAGDLRVLEMPWADSTPAGLVFLRDFSLGPRTRATTLGVLPEPLPDVPEVAVDVRYEPGAGEVPGTLRLTRRTGGRVQSTTVIAPEGSFRATEDGAAVVIQPDDTEMLLGVAYWTGPEEALDAYLEWERKHFELYEVTLFTRPGPGRWPALETSGQRGPDREFLAVDTLTLPYDNPWGALLFGSGVDVSPDGAVYFSTMHGDVWRVTGVDDTLRRLTWKRFATGLFQPLGLKVRDGGVFVLGRDRITRLVDHDGDGEADFYKSFYDGIATSTGGHDYVTCLETDREGNFYYVDPVGVHRVSANGRSQETLATGFRNPNGMGASPDGRVVTVAPQQGEWTPSSLIAEVRRGGYYGYGGPRPGPDRPAGYDAPLCWIPHAVDNSSGSQVWVPEGHWGALGGHMLHLLWGRCGMMLVLRDTGGDPGAPARQGAVVPLPVKFSSGPNRGSFDARDGSLLVAGSTGWQTSALKDGALQRVRYIGKPMALPVGFRVLPDALQVTFSQPLDPETAGDPDSYGLRQWNYRYARNYGSKEWSVARPDQEGRDEVAITSAILQPDGRTVILGVPGLGPVMQWELRYNLEAREGPPMRGSLWGTVNP